MSLECFSVNSSVSGIFKTKLYDLIQQVFDHPALTLTELTQKWVVRQVASKDMTGVVRAMRTGSGGERHGVCLVGNFYSSED